MSVAQQNHLNSLDSFTLKKGWAFPQSCAFTLREQLRWWFWITWRLRDDFLHLLSEVVFRSLELFGVAFAPFHPDSNQQGLEYPCDRRSEERSRDPKEFGPGDQGGERDHGVQANGLPDDARPHHIALDHMHNDEVNQHDEGDDPPPGEGEQHTDRTRDERSQHGNEL